MSRHLGAGGMASLYLARERGAGGFEKLVAIKQLHPHLAANREFVQLVLDAARLQARLQHANVVQVSSVGEEAGAHYLVMEYVAGRDLALVIERARARGRRLALDEVLALAIGLCAGLHHAHELRDERGAPAGVVHRDVSPSNVLVGFDGSVKVGDFGIARSTLRSKQTTGNTVRGKVHYMAPEQCLSQPLDRRSDLFAVGAILYELCAGQSPWWGASELEVMQHVVERDVVPPSIHGAVHPALERVVMRALRREREQRYQTGDELIADLEAVARAEAAVLSPRVVERLMAELFPADLTASSDELKPVTAPSVRTDTLDRPRAAGQAASETLILDRRRPRSQRRFIAAATAAVGAAAAAVAIAWAWSSTPPATASPTPTPTPAPIVSPMPTPDPIPTPDPGPSPSPITRSITSPSTTPSTITRTPARTRAKRAARKPDAVRRPPKPAPAPPPEPKKKSWDLDSPVLPSP